MRRRVTMPLGKKTAAVLAVALAAAAPLCSEEGRFQVALAGGFQRHFSYGSERDYVQGEHDFPVTPAHDASVFGLSLSYAFKPWLAVEYDGRFIGSSSLILRDPSDGDLLRCRSNRHFSFALNFILRLPGGRIRPYLFFGGGLDRIEAKEETVISDFGHEVYLPPPSENDLVAPLLQFGSGVEVGLFRAFGIRLDGRYALVLADPASVRSVSLTAGFFLRI